MTKNGTKNRFMKFTPTKLAAIAWALGITVFSLLPAQAALSTGSWDKLEHGASYAILALLARTAWPPQQTRTIALICILFGSAIEAGQFFSPGRHADLWDILANGIGTGLGLFFHWIWHQRLHSRPVDR